MGISGSILRTHNVLSRAQCGRSTRTPFASSQTRANREVDNAVVQAQYLEAVLEVDPDYLVRRVESGRYAVDDDVHYLYRKALLAVEVS